MGDNILQLYAHFKQLCEDVNMNTLSNRIELQKTVYFLKQFGANLRYSFTWYIYGPYSTDLARDLFSIQENQNLIPNDADWNTIIQDAEPIRRTKSFIDEVERKPRPQETDNHYWFELLAGLHYLLTYSPTRITTEAELIETLENHKPRKFRLEDMREGLRMLKAHNLVSNDRI